MSIENIANFIHFPVGTCVKKIGPCHYSHAGDNSGIAENQIGIVWKIRSRYQGTSNAYHLYIIKFDKVSDYEFNENELNNQYTYYSLEKI